MLNMQMRPYFRQIVSGIAEYANQHQHPSWKLSLPNYYSYTHRFPVDEADTYDGVITGISKDSFLNRWHQAGKAVSLIGFKQPCTADLTYTDLDRIVRLGTQLLEEGGASHIAYCGLDETRDAWSQEMITGIRALHPTASLFLNQPDYKYQYEQEFILMSDWLKTLPPRTGILTGSDDYAGRIYEAAEHAGCTPGKEFTVLGLGNDPIYCESLRPSLSSIQLPLRNMGYMVAQRLSERLQNPSLPKRHLESGQPMLIKRSSHYFHEVEDPLADKAMSRLRANLATIRSVTELADQVGTSRHTLQRRLKAVLGKPPAEVIREVRIQEARRLLTTTSMTLAEVAADSGFTDQAHLTRVMKAELGKTPGQLVRESKGTG